MQFDWDPEKSASNEEKHGVTFDAMHSFLWEFARLDKIEFVDTEEREAHIGPIGDKLYTVILTPRDEGALRIISLRRSTNEEIKRWQEEFYD